MGTVDREFEKLVMPFLEANPSVSHQWRSVHGWLSGDRRDLVCAEGTPREVFVTLRPGDAVVGTREFHDDYQDFGSGQSDAEIASEAFARFVELLRENGHLDRAL
jgi:hypothetical protein